MSEEEKEAIEYYQDKEVSFTLENFDKKEFLKSLGITETEEDSFENHQIRFKTLLNLIEKQDKMIDKLETKLMFALSPTNHELALNTQSNFKRIIRENIDSDTYTIRKELKEYWNNPKYWVEKYEQIKL